MTYLAVICIIIAILSVLFLDLFPMHDSWRAQINARYTAWRTDRKARQDAKRIRRAVDRYLKAKRKAKKESGD